MINKNIVTITTMKKTIIAFAITICVNINAQITIGNVEKKKEEVKVSKAPIYDSLKNIEPSQNHDGDDGPQENRDPMIYTKYIGCQFYHIPSYIPKMVSYKNGNFSAVSDCSDKYYILLAILNKGPGFEDNYPLLNKIRASWSFQYCCSEMEHTYNSQNLSHQRGLVLFQMKDVKTGDTLYCSRLHVFILVPYFLKQKSLFEKKSLISDMENHQKTDLITNKQVSIEKNSKWLCSEVTLLKRNQGYPNHEAGFGDGAGSTQYYHDDDNYADEYSIFYILKNSNNETIALESLKKIGYQLGGNNFIFEQDYLKNKNDLITASNRAEKSKNDERQKQKAGYIKKYGQNYGAAIAEGNVKIGMTMEMCQAAWGILYESTKITNEQGTLETWRFMNMRSVPIGTLRFVNGILKEIVEH